MGRLILGLIVYIAVASAKPICPPCDKTKCIVPLNCKDGKTVTDECGCCSVCSRVEGEECGGVSSELGVCGKGLMCKVRHPNSIRNSLLPPDFKIGRCEPGEFQHFQPENSSVEETFWLASGEKQWFCSRKGCVFEFWLNHPQVPITQRTSKFAGFLFFEDFSASL